MATKLGLDQPAAPEPPARKRAPRREQRSPATDAADTPWWKRRSPVIDRVLVTLALFGAFLYLSMYFAQLEVAWNAAVPGSGDVYNQPHRHVQFGAGTLFGWLLLAVYDLLANRSITLGEAFRNTPNPGREHIFKPMSAMAQAAAIRFYGIQYAAVPIAQAIVWGN